MALIAPSLLAADFARLGEALQFMKEAGASMVHVDVMDGHFVSELTVGQPVIKSLRKATDLVLDLHLLIERPERFVREFIEAGADRVAIHAEATPNLRRALSEIRAGGAQAGLALNPATAVDSVADVLGEIDYLLILSSDGGFANSSFIPGTIGKIETACTHRRERKLKFTVQVEGSIAAEQIEALEKAGADILVAGSDIFQKDSPNHWLELMRQAAAVNRVSRI
jgi:ribulose-phosphate 3-epimerase